MFRNLAFSFRIPQFEARMINGKRMASFKPQKSFIRNGKLLTSELTAKKFDRRTKRDEYFQSDDINKADNIINEEKSEINCKKYALISIEKEYLFRFGQLLAYDKAIEAVVGKPSVGELIPVYNSNHVLIGKGFYNPYSLYKIRFLAPPGDTDVNLSFSELLEKKIKQAIDLRRSLNLPSESTNVYRLVNAEGDFLSGLIIDVFDDNIKVQSSSLWVEVHGDLIAKILKKHMNDKDYKYIWQQSIKRLKQDGLETFESEFDLVIRNQFVEESGTYSIRENDIIYTINPSFGQKTGYFCDQRENRLRIKELSRNRNVLDLFCYFGSFGLNALKGGAKAVTCVDQSYPALQSLESNFKLNFPEKKSIDTLNIIHGDSMEVMKKLIKLGNSYDLIICDPPKLAPTQGSLNNAEKEYLELNKLAMSLINPESGGLLLTCTCSYAMTTSGRFTTVLTKAASAAGRRVSILSQYGPSFDHTTNLGTSDNNYFLSILLFIH